MRHVLPSALLVFVAATTSVADYKKNMGPAEVAVKKVEWKDRKRDRAVPAKFYFPKSGGGPFPVIVFSHGLGGSRDGYEYLGRHWASHGYVAVHLQHLGSDEAVWKGSKAPLVALRKATRNLTNAVNRPLDVRFALDQITTMNKEDADLKGRLDLERVGMAGHSFGGWTTQAVVGQLFVVGLGKEQALGDKRVKAGIIMSLAGAGEDGQSKAFGAIKVPCLHLTGTKDDGVAITEVKPADRRVPFDHMKGADQYLIVFKDGDHMVFAGAKRRKGRPGKQDAVFLDLVRMSTTAFWDAHLKGDERARKWLTEGAARKAIGKEGTFERRAAGK